MTKPALKIAPYGESNFLILRENNLAYVDKTEFIEKLESLKNRYPFIIRPRRFGKTLFTLTLEAYYDIAQAKDFDRNFAGTYIGQHKTRLANTFRVLRFEFTGIDPADFKAEFITNLKGSLRTFCTKYNFEKGRELLKKEFDNPVTLMTEFFNEYDDAFKEKICVIIDEYDQSANNVLTLDVEAFKALTNEDGVLKRFYTFLKRKGAEGPIGLIFITGITSIQLDSMTSGYSVAKNLTTDGRFATMFGFTESELRHLIPQIVDLKEYGKTLEEIFSRMKEWYNGYCFSPKTQETVFNSSMCLNYLSAIADFGEEPENMLDSSVANSLDKIESILSLGDKNYVREIVEKSLKHEAISFGGDLKLLNLNQHKQFEKEELLSALFYMGFLTFVKGNSKQLIVPNRAIGIQFFEYYFKNVLQSSDYKFDNKEFEAADKALCEGNPGPWLRLADARLNEDSGIHVSAHINEAALQMVLSATLWFSSNYRGRLEFESRGENSGYIDLLLRARNPKYSSYVIELKHLTKDAKEDEVKTALNEAKDQAERYANGEEIKEIPNLKRLAVVYTGLKLNRLEVF